MGFRLTSECIIGPSHPDYEKLADDAEKRINSIGPMPIEEYNSFLKELDSSVQEKAKYKIEVIYQEARKASAPSVCSMTVWESGKKLHGGGDQSMFWCINSKNVEEGCGSLIPDEYCKNGSALCPHCKRTVNLSFLPIQKVGVFTARNLAKETVKVFRHLGSDADIYLKFHLTDFQAMARLRGEGKKVTEAAIYQLKNIISDIANGSDIVDRVEAFLRA